MDWTSELVPYAITVCGVDELPEFSSHPITHVLSILDPGLPPPEAFSTYPAHARLDVRFHDSIKPMEGQTLASAADIDLVLAFGRDLDSHKSSAHLLVHCQMGVSRSTASMLLLLAQTRPDVSAKALMAEVARIRPRAWPNSHVVRLGDALLKREGTLLAAAREQHRERLETFPQLAEFFRSVGREEEVDG